MAGRAPVATMIRLDLSLPTPSTSKVSIATKRAVPKSTCAPILRQRFGSSWWATDARAWRMRSMTLQNTWAGGGRLDPQRLGITHCMRQSSRPQESL